MNKATKVLYKKLTKEEYGFFVVIGIERCSKIWKKLNDQKYGHSSHADPKPLVKFVIRTLFQFGEKRMTLVDLKNKVDQYQKTKFFKFAKSFSFDKNIGGFVPMYYKLTGSLWLKNFYDAKRDGQIQRVWEKAKCFLTSPNGGTAILVHKFEKSHVYFMQNLDNKEIKIGVSIHPEIRRKQLIAEKGSQIEILHIIPSGGDEEETRLHEYFRNYRTHGEWFAPDSKLTEFISQMKS